MINDELKRFVPTRTTCKRGRRQRRQPTNAAGVVFYVAGVVFGGQQACPGGAPGGPGLTEWNQPCNRPGPPRPPTTYRLVAMGYQRGRRSILRGRRGIWRPAGTPKGAPVCACLTELSQVKNGPGPPDPQQPIVCWIWAFSVAGIVFYVAGVVFGGQQARPKVLQGGGV